MVTELSKQTNVAQQGELEIEQWDRTYVWHGFTQMADYDPLVIERAEGNWLIDVHGRRLLDGVSSLWCIVHGHGHPRIMQAMRDQLDLVTHVTSLGMGSATTATLAHQLVLIAPPGLQHVFFSSDGSSAVEAAVKMAFQYWQQGPPAQHARTRFVALGNAYHGDTTGSTSLGGVDLFHKLFGPILFDVLRGPCPDTYRLPKGIGAEDACDYYLKQLESLLKSNHGTIAAIIVEPLVQGAAGMVMHPRGFLKGVRELANREGCLLICDEVATGFGRTGEMFACQHEGVSPDLMCLGKGLSGGYLPIAATLATKQIWDVFLSPSAADGKQFFHGHTFGGNPLAAAAALASLEVFSEERTLERVAELERQLANALKPLNDHPHVGSVRQRGLMVGIELVQDRVTQQPFDKHELRGAKVCQRALKMGVWIRPLGDVVVLMPPLSITDDELSMLAAALCRSIELEFAAELGR